MGIIIVKSVFFIVATLFVIAVAIRGERKLAKERASVLAIRAWCLVMSAVTAVTAILAVHDIAYAYFASHPETYETPEAAGTAGVAMLIGSICMAAVALFVALKKDGETCRKLAVWRAAARARREMEWRI